MYYIGLDVGTSSVKALLVSQNGEVVRSATPEYPFQTPKPMWAETDPDVWWDATQQAIRTLLEEVNPEEIAAVDIDKVFGELGLGEHLTPNRRNGFFSMVQRIRSFGLLESAAN